LLACKADTVLQRQFSCNEMFSTYRIAIISPLFWAAATFAGEAPQALLPETHFNFLNDYCLDCHDSFTQEGSVDLETASFDLGELQTAELWQKVLNVLNSGDMPPEDENQPRAKEKTDFLSDLSNTLVTARKILSDSGGVITMRRLNRREYENTIEDLLGVAIDAKELPKDASTGSFDTVGSALFFSSDQFEQYLKIARRALTSALNTPANAPPSRKRQESEIAINRTVQNRYEKLLDGKIRGDKWRESDKPPTEFGFIDAARVKFEAGLYKRDGIGYAHYLSLPETKSGAVFYATWSGALTDTITLPEGAPPGEYIIRARVGGFETAPTRRRFLEVGTVETGARSGELAILDYRKVTGTYDEPQIVEFPITITPSSSRKIGVRERQHNNRDAARFVFKKARDRDEPLEEPALWIDWLEWEGPIENKKLSEFQQLVFKNSPEASQSDEYVRDTIKRFASHAFRTQEPSEPFLEKLMGLYQNRRQAGDDFRAALVEPLSVVLASPAFLYLNEPKPSDRKRALTDLELAVRLSYFLWSRPPDAELYKAARSGRLKNPSELRRQTDRMLEDPKAWDFISGFTSQWLHMDRLDFFQFNYELYPDFDDSAKSASRDEIFHTLKTILEEDLSIKHLLKSDFVVINDLLAEYYGIDGVEGHRFRKVPLPEGSPRGGLTGTAAVLAMGSDGERTSPVERGVWVLRKLLNDPPPPAPANVPQLSRLAEEQLPARELQIAHMEEPQCAQCHREIDPIGYAFQNFDAAGKWRQQERISAVKKGQKDVWANIDPSGSLPDGTPFHDYFELRDRLSERSDALARGLTEALIAYGLGRPYGFTDYDLAEAILEEAKSQDYQSRSFIHAIVQSEPFSQK
jgi:hypothetical protein